MLEAEHNLKAANANIGVARAAYFPSITLTTKGGVGSSTLSGLFSGGTSTIWSFVPNISLPLFDAGEREANLDYAKAKRDVYVATYEATIQTAFKEVSSALARRSTISEQYNAQKALVEANKQSYTLYDARYQKGVDTYLNVLLAERLFYNSEQSLISVRLEELNNRVSLYRVLGGGLHNNSLHVRLYKLYMYSSFCLIKTHSFCYQVDIMFPYNCCMKGSQMSVNKVYVLDTNIILHNTNFIKELCDGGNNIIVIPETVLIELEDFKKNFTELGYQARSFARMLASCKVEEVDSGELFRVVKMRYEEDIAIHLFSKTLYSSDIDSQFINESNDKRILEVASGARTYYPDYKVIFLSLDVYARMFGLFYNVTVESLREDRGDVPEFEFVKQLPVDSALLIPLIKS